MGGSGRVSSACRTPWLAALLVFASCAAAFATEPPRIRRGDILNIEVYQSPDLTRSVRVDSNGKIRFPLVGEQLAEGMTLDEITVKIAEALRWAIRAPQVLVRFANGASSLGTGDEIRSVHIAGFVQRPGGYDFGLHDSMSAIDAIKRAGGVRADGSMTRVKILRGDSVQTADLVRCLGDSPADNCFLSLDDLVFVPRLRNCRYFYIEDGKSGGVVERLPCRTDLIQLLASIAPSKAAPSPDIRLGIELQIVRDVFNSPKVFSERVRLCDFCEDPDFLLEHGDIVFLNAVAPSELISRARDFVALLPIIQDSGSVDATSSRPAETED